MTQEKETRFASFGAKYLRFLAPAVCSEFSASKWNVCGVTVLPCPDGGVTLFATNGRITLMARDKNGSCSPDGMRISIPEAAFNACVPPAPHKLQWEGVFCDIEGSIPDYAVPDTVLALDVCLIVMPKGQPEGTEENYGGALFSCRLDREYCWNDDTYTIADAYPWHSAISHWMNATESVLGLSESQKNIGVGPGTIPTLGQAMECFPDSVWSVQRLPSDALMLLPNNRDDLMIFVAMASVPTESPIPTWLDGAAK
ncbi:hypothetical protein HKD24_09160 [Gluconobacter sp. LMG 31484]|uniref:Uncharacterized protein n=1 Tax=Gluconobacter vitians TaxID=2728102 RepID=A0ABR9Y6I3_9PROT|nr:hypothetical protein [Gluconobacter vitians]MBF0859381.1 hypothetical protein [Gluconobacter vitians]